MTKMNTKHWENCPAPICMDKMSDDVVWWAGEEICSKSPATKLQKRQRRINQEHKKGKLQDKVWTTRELLDSSL